MLLKNVAAKAAAIVNEECSLFNITLVIIIILNNNNNNNSSNNSEVV